MAKHATTAARSCASIAAKSVSPHVLRHSCAMNFLHAGVDVAVIALWLGHESSQTTQIYVHADMALKEQALARTTPPHTKPGRYRPPNPLPPSWRACDYAESLITLPAPAKGNRASREPARHNHAWIRSICRTPSN